MGLIDAISLSILLGALLVFAGILSSLVALRFGAPLLLVFMLVGMLAGEAGPGGIKFDDVQLVYTVGSMALAVILFDGGLRTRAQTIRSVALPAFLLATVGVLITAALTAPVVRLTLPLSWTEGFLLGAVIASTDAAAVFLLLHARGLRLRPRLSAILEVESGSNDPFAIFLTIVLVSSCCRAGNLGRTSRSSSPRRPCSAPSSACSAGGRWYGRSTVSPWRRVCTPRSWSRARW